MSGYFVEGGPIENLRKPSTDYMCAKKNNLKAKCNRPMGVVRDHKYWGKSPGNNRIMNTFYFRIQAIHRYINRLKYINIRCQSKIYIHLEFFQSIELEYQIHT